MGVGVMLAQANALRLPLADASVHCVVTSPPYWGLRDYGIPGQLGLEDTPEEYVAKMVAVFREVRRVLREDGTCWVVLGDSYAGSQRVCKDTLTRKTPMLTHWTEGTCLRLENLASNPKTSLASPGASRSPCKPMAGGCVLT